MEDAKPYSAQEIEEYRACARADPGYGFRNRWLATLAAKQAEVDGLVMLSSDLNAAFIEQDAALARAVAFLRRTRHGPYSGLNEDIDAFLAQQQNKEGASDTAPKAASGGEPVGQDPEARVAPSTTPTKPARCPHGQGWIACPDCVPMRVTHKHDTPSEEE